MNWYKIGNDIFGYGTREQAIEYAKHLGLGITTITENDLADAMQYGITLQDALDSIEEGRNALREW